MQNGKATGTTPGAGQIATCQKCTICPIGKVSTAAGFCTDCAVGKYQDLTGQKVCKAGATCAAGKYLSAGTLTSATPTHTCTDC